MPRILVSYASRFGSTTEIASVIAEELTGAGNEVDVHPVNPLIQVSRYDAVIIGSPAYGRTWLHSASVFVVGNGRWLSSMPVALFTAGMLGVKNPKSALAEHEAIIATLRDLTPGLEPVSTALFHGSFSRQNLPFCLRIIDWMAGTPQGDHRDWEAIRRWARSTGERIAGRLAGDGQAATAPIEDDTHGEQAE